MTRSGKIVAIALGSIAVLAAGWTGAGMYAGRVAADQMRTFASGTPMGPGVTIAAARHETGLFESGGRFEVRVDEHCDPSSADGANFALQVDYRLSHRPLPGSMMRFEWTMTPAGEAGAMLSKVTDGALRLEGQGTVSYARALASTLAMPEIVLGSGAQALRISPGNGRFTLAGGALGLQWKTDRIAGRGAGKALEVTNLGIDADLQDAARGTGSMTLSVERVGTGFGTVEGFRLVSAAVARGDRTDVTINPSLRSLTAPGQKASDLSMEVSVRDMHTASLETIQRISRESCSFRLLKPEEARQLRVAVRTLLTSGLALGVDSIRGTIGEGSLEGFLKVELKKAAPAPAAVAEADAVAVDLSRLLSSRGEIMLKGNAVTAQQREMAVGMGIASAQPGGLKAAFDYADGILKVNGRVFDAGPLQVALSAADRRLNTFLGVALPVERAPAGALQPAEPAPMADEAPPPAAPPNVSPGMAPNVLPNVLPAAPPASLR
jgi:hypothetical protein